MSSHGAERNTDSRFAPHPDWDAAGGWPGVAETDDPHDELFGHVVEPVTFDSADELDAVLVGEPYDGAVIGRKGARHAPLEIRRSLARTKTHHFEGGAVRSIGDLGDVRTLLDDGDDGDDDRSTTPPVDTVQTAIVETAALVHELDALPVFLGGDNSLTYPNVAPLCHTTDAGTVGVVTVDAHLDVREPIDGPTSGTPYRQLFEAGLDHYACVGARHFETSTDYHEFVREQDGTVITAEAVGDDTEAAATRALQSMADADSIYVSIDCDVLDASAAPGVSAPTPGGLSTRELYRLLRHLVSDDRLAGVELVECAPPLDRDGTTVDAAARAIAHVLAGYLEPHGETEAETEGNR